MAATETLLNGATEVTSSLNAPYTAGGGTMVLPFALNDHGFTPLAGPFEILVGRNRPSSERRYFVATPSGSNLTVVASPGYTDDQNYIAGDLIDVISAWETQRRQNAFDLLHTHTGGVDGAALPAYKAYAYHSTTQSLTDSTPTALNLDSERYDNDTIHDLVTNNSRLTAKHAGNYHITGAIAFASNATGGRQARIRLNGATVLAIQVQVAASGMETVVQVACDQEMAVNDYVELMGYQNSGGALNSASDANYAPIFQMKAII